MGSRSDEMSLTRRQFEIGVDGRTEDWMHRLYAYLSENRHLAFTAEELFQNLTSDEFHDQTRSEWALDALVDVWAIEIGKVAGVIYYTFYQDMDTAVWRPRPEPSVARHEG